MSDAPTEKIMFQYIMNYKAYRRRMILTRLTATVVVAGGLCGLCAISVPLGLVLAAIALSFGILSVLFALSAERSYTVYDTRIVLKVRGKDVRTTVPLDSIVSVKYKRAFYEKGLCTDTVTFIALDDKGKKKKYRLRHIFDAQPVVEYLNERIKSGETNEDRK